MARPKRQGTLLLKQVLEQLQNSGEENAKIIIKTDPIVSEILMVSVMRLSLSAVCTRQAGMPVCCSQVAWLSV